MGTYKAYCERFPKKLCNKIIYLLLFKHKNLNSNNNMIDCVCLVLNNTKSMLNIINCFNFLNNINSQAKLIVSCYSQDNFNLVDNYCKLISKYYQKVNYIVKVYYETNQTIRYLYLLSQNDHKSIMLCNKFLSSFQNIIVTTSINDYLRLISDKPQLRQFISEYKSSYENPEQSILYVANWNISQLSYFYPIIYKYGGAIYCNVPSVIDYIKTSIKYNNFKLFTNFQQLVSYDPKIIIYTQYDYINIPHAIHVSIGHGPCDPNFESYTHHLPDNNILKRYDIISCSGQYDLDSFRFRNKIGNFKILGNPKQDIKPDDIAIFPDRNKKIILYAPSWSYKCSKINISNQILELSKDYYICILPHSLLIQNEDHKETLIQLIKKQNNNLRIVCRNSELIKYYKLNPFSIYFDSLLDDSLPFIKYSDIVITDLSSFIGETSLLNKPIYITIEEDKLSKILIEKRVKLNKTDIFIKPPIKEVKSFDREYIFKNMGDKLVSDAIIQEAVKLYKLRF